MIEVLSYITMTLGAAFMLIASIGVIRLDDFYLRIHAPTKAATLGLGFLLTALMLRTDEHSAVTKALLALFFIAATAPIGAHLLFKAAYKSGIPPRGKFNPDEYSSYIKEMEI